MSQKSLEERISVLETKVEYVTKELGDINTKLDELLILRHKGVGAFWLASALLGTGIVGTITAFIEWFRA